MPDGHSEGDEQDDRDADEPGRANQTERGRTDEVGGEADGGRPGCPAQGVPEGEAPPGHPMRAGEPGGGDPQAREPATEEDRLAAVPAKEHLSPLEEMPPPLGPATLSCEQTPGPLATNDVADVVADDRGARGRADRRSACDGFVLE
jgi:hypothetical protein